MKSKKKVQLHKKWWLWASIGVIILSIITGEGSGIGIRMSKEAALEEAEECLRYGAYSYEGLIEELTEYRGFTEDAAVYAADNCGADWNEQALEAAENKLNYGSYSYDGLIDALVYDDFTREQAEYAADNCGADWKEQAKKAAEDYGDGFFSDKSALKKFLQREGFTDDQIRYAIE